MSVVLAANFAAVAPVEDTTPEEADEWVRRQVSPTFAALARLGMLDVGALLDEGRKRLNPKHQRWQGRQRWVPVAAPPPRASYVTTMFVVTVPITADPRQSR